MKVLVMYLCEFTSILFPFILIYIYLDKYYKNKGIYRDKEYFMERLIFIIYIFGVYHFTGLPTLADIKLFGLEFNMDHINLIPFVGKINKVEVGLNIILFIPFGFLLPFIWSKLNKFIYIILSSATFSLLIEVSQLLNNRRSDINDIIWNTLGGIIGYLIFKLFRLFKKSSKGKDDEPMEYEIIIYIVLLFIFRFIFFNEYKLAKYLYGF